MTLELNFIHLQQYKHISKIIMTTLKSKKKSTHMASEKQPQNKPRTIRTSDDKQFKVVDSLLMKYSLFLKNLMEDQKSEEQTIKLPEIDSETFEIINEFMQLHKDKQVAKIDYPLKSNQDIKQVLDEGDAALVEKVMERGDQFLTKVLQASAYLLAEQLKKRLIAGLAIRLMKHTVAELKVMHEIKENDLKDDQIRQQVKNRLKYIAEIKQDQ